MFTANVNNVLNELLDDSWRNDISRYRSRFVFRGLSNYAYDLKPAVARLNGHYLENELEYHLLRNFRKYSVIDSNPAHVSLWRQIAIAQHHRLPTRLLDWSFSPFVALHFATCDFIETKAEIDAVVWCVNAKLVHGFLPDNLRDRLQDIGCDMFSTRMLDGDIESIPKTSYPIKSQLERFNSLEQEDNPFAIFFEPPSLDERIVNQYALFSAMSRPGLPLDEWLRSISLREDRADGSEIGRVLGDQIIYKKVKIPHSLKWEIRNRLDQANITERILFPGLDGLAEWLKRHYGPSPMKKS